MGLLNWNSDDADEEPAEDDEFDLDDEGDVMADALDDEWDDGMDDEWGDEFGDEDDQLVHDLQDKVNGMETELGGVSSSMKTIKEENKRIAETVDELDDTIRKLLDVYEIVTRGINPFIDDAQAMANMNNEGSFGLFGDVEEENDDSLDPSLTGANAESFFDDDFDDAVPDPGPDPEAGVDGAGADADPTDALTADDDGLDDDGESGAGISFEDLKAEYEAAGDEDWEEADDDADGASDDADDASDGLDDASDGLDDASDGLDDEAFADAHFDGESSDETVDFDDLDDFDDFEGGVLDDGGFDEDENDLDDGFDENDDDLDDGFDEDENDLDDEGFGEDDLDDDDFEGDGSAEADGEALPDPDELLGGASDTDNESVVAGADDASPGAALTTNCSSAHSDEPPAPADVTPVENAQNGDENVANEHDSPDPNGDYHLGRVPGTYVAELLLLEWAEQLVAVGGTAGAMDACRYYERLGWISPSVSDRLSTHVVETAVAPHTDRTETFDVDDHVRSLGYVSRLGGDPSARLVELAIPGGESGGIRG